MRSRWTSDRPPPRSHITPSTDRRAHRTSSTRMTPEPDLFDPPPPDDGSEGAINLAHYAERAYLEYALSVVKGRALPDVLRRPEAGAAPHPLFDGTHGPGVHHRRRPESGQERARGRRRARQVPPARRHRGLRRDGAHGAGLLAALPVGRRPGQLRFARRRRRRGDALHGSPPRADHAPAARRTRRGHRRFHRQLRRFRAGAAPVAGATAIRSAQRGQRHRGRTGDRGAAAQPAPRSPRPRSR